MAALTFSSGSKNNNVVVLGLLVLLEFDFATTSNLHVKFKSGICISWQRRVWAESEVASLDWKLTSELTEENRMAQCNIGRI